MSIAMISLSGYIIYFFEPHRAAHAALPLKLKPFRPLPIRFGNALHRFLKETFDIEMIPLNAENMIEAACERHLKATNATCDFDPTSTITLTERVLQPESFQVNLQLCKSDFRSDWDAISMGYSAFDVLPKNLADFLIAHAAEKVAAGMSCRWCGGPQIGDKIC